MLKSAPLTGHWNLKLPALTVAGYILVLFPVLQIGLGNPRGVVSLALPTYCFLVVISLVLLKKLRWEQLGFRQEHWRQNLLLGVLSGLLILVPIPLLDGFITVSGLEESDLFAGAQHRAGGSSGTLWTPLATVGDLLLIPFFEQAFFTGFVFQALLKKYKPALAVYIAALVFVLLHFKFTISTFGIGMICSWFYLRTGNLLAPTLFHTAAQAGGFLLTLYYPRVVTFLGFLF